MACDVLAVVTDATAVVLVLGARTAVRVFLIIPIDVAGGVVAVFGAADVAAGVVVVVAVATGVYDWTLVRIFTFLLNENINVKGMMKSICSAG